jgi:hypothetical protein
MKSFEINLSLAEGALVKQLLAQHAQEMLDYIEDCSLYATEEDETIEHLFEHVEQPKPKVDAPYGLKKDGTPKAKPGRAKKD